MQWIVKKCIPFISTQNPDIQALETNKKIQNLAKPKMLIKYASGPTSHPQYSPYTCIFLVCCYCCNPSLGLWHGSYSEVLVARRMPANITGKHPKLRSRRKDQKMFRVNHLALQMECNQWLRNAYP